MYNHIKVKNHKGVKNIHLNDLGRINILFGKNNSGKTSIMEGINDSEKSAIGKPVKEIDSLTEYFRAEAEKYFSNFAKKAVRTFRDYLEDLRSKKAVWYLGEEEEIIRNCTEDLSKTKDLQNIRSMFNLSEILGKWFQDTEEGFNPILVPPKRKLESRVEVNLNQKITSFGSGIANHLFYLKNQNTNSDEHNNYRQIFYAFSEISDYEFDIVPAAENHIQIVFKRLNEEKWIPAEDSGLGLADLLILITFSLGTSGSVVCIEEPESHLHPEMQKRFLTFLNTIRDKQFIISTHSNIFLNPSIVDSIFFTQYIDGEVKVKNETESSKILYNLGYSISDHLIADAVILVEHSSVIPVLHTIFSWIGLNKRFNINYFPLTGDVRAYLDLSIFSGRPNITALTYTRGDTEVATARFYHNCESRNINVYRLKRASIENYFTIPALRQVFGTDIPEEVKSIEHHISVDAQIGFSLRHKSVKTHNSQIIQAMSLDDLNRTDLLDFCEKMQKSLTKIDILDLPLPENNRDHDYILMDA